MPRDGEVYRADAQREGAPPRAVAAVGALVAPRADLLGRLREQMGVERLLQHELERLPAGIFEQSHYLALR